ncbi:MAG: RNA 2',3'-cyclic phosphodiesterase [Planctomycetota bacterium]|jgi:2'-5' RNA ligase
MSRERPTLRLFVAIYPPPVVVRALLASVPGSRLPPHRLVPEAQVHITLQFIGDCPVSDLDATTESVRRSASGLGGFELEVMRLISLPERGPARLVAAETDAPSPLLELKDRLVRRLAREPRREHRKFRPHLTLLRYRRPTRSGRLDEVVTIEPASFGVEKLMLMKSTLRPEGALHEVVEQVDLGSR